jgi:uncharacterized protein YkwD
MACMESYARVAQGLPPLRVYKPLDASATRRAHEIRQCQRFDHHPCGRSFSQWVAGQRALKGAWWMGEILAFGAVKRETASATMADWLHSDRHRAVLFERKFNLVGVGTVTGRFLGSGSMRIWVSHLGYRR